MSITPYRFFDNSDLHNMADMAIYSAIMYGAKQLWSRRKSLRLNNQKKWEFYVATRVIFIFSCAVFDLTFTKIHLTYLSNKFGRIGLVTFFDLAIEIGMHNKDARQELYELYKILDEYFINQKVSKILGTNSDLS